MGHSVSWVLFRSLGALVQSQSTFSGKVGILREKEGDGGAGVRRYKKEYSQIPAVVRFLSYRWLR